MTIDRSGAGPVAAALALLILLGSGCSVGDEAGHDHGAAGAGEDEHDNAPAGESVVVTDHSAQTELFVEFPPLVAGETSRFAAHITRLSDFQPMRAGRLDVVLEQDGRTVARFRVNEPARAGLFTPAVTPREAGEFRLLVRVQGEGLEVEHDLGSFRVYDSPQAARVTAPAPEGDINYLKEQQWTDVFATEPVVERPLRPSVLGFATVTAPADAGAELRAPADGHIAHRALSRAGDRVAAGEVLGFVVPRLGAETDFGRLRVDLEQARSTLALARRDVERLAPLFEQGAVPERRLIEARERVEVAQAEFEAARARLQQYEQGDGVAGIALRSPVAGEVVEVTARPGAFVRAGDRVFRVASPERRWLEVRLPERFAGDIGRASGAWLEGNDGSVVVLDQATGARVVQTEAAVHPVTRTVGVTLDYPVESGPRLIGARLPAHVFVAESQSRLALPRSAVVEDGGREVVYVQTGGETFARRPVRLGAIDGDYVAVLSGVSAGERVVSKGAYPVRLAAAGGNEIGHGHAH
ncbi:MULTISPECIES: efflux RND transporter periplasmic adaptor subunit [unclassified Wenzhouxiangella]|uniref:efflux RND transporter periplasmic adaptor subunit n=1 Tax=unclassified Wenzhouxiangella TaxID=2613841 RepID=UPI0015F25D15|nr:MULTISPECIES: efflux RND transporter periplasmic adaptor subunit [unclassified Wenzhouxiangella]